MLNTTRKRIGVGTLPTKPKQNLAQNSAKKIKRNLMTSATAMLKRGSQRRGGARKRTPMRGVTMTRKHF